MIDRLLEKDGKPEEYDINMRLNDVHHMLVFEWKHLIDYSL